MINCKKWLPNLGEDLFLENTLILGRKLGNMRLIPREDLFFREHHDFRTKFGLRLIISDNVFVLSVKY